MLKTTFTRSVVSIILAFSALNVSFAVASAGNVTGGPDKFDDWQVVGPSGGDVRCITIDPRDKDKLYASTLDGQIHTSSDGGKTWRLLVNLNQSELILDNLFVDSRDSQKIYASGHRHQFPGGFFRSTDGGATWKDAKELRKESIHSMMQSSFDPKVLLAFKELGRGLGKDTIVDDACEYRFAGDGSARNGCYLCRHLVACI